MPPVGLAQVVNVCANAHSSQDRCRHLGDADRPVCCRQNPGLHLSAACLKLPGLHQGCFLASHACRELLGEGLQCMSRCLWSAPSCWHCDTCHACWSRWCQGGVRQTPLCLGDTGCPPHVWFRRWSTLGESSCVLSSLALSTSRTGAHRKTASWLWGRLVGNLGDFCSLLRTSRISAPRDLSSMLAARSRDCAIFLGRCPGQLDPTVWALCSEQAACLLCEFRARCPGQVSDLQWCFGHAARGRSQTCWWCVWALCPGQVSNLLNSEV